jgi:uncharacterized protein YecT (DUF1311 family)
VAIGMTAVSLPGAVDARTRNAVEEAAFFLDERSPAMVRMFTVAVVAALLGLGWTVANAASRPADAYSQCRKHAMSTADIAACQRAELARLNPRLRAVFARLRANVAGTNGLGRRLDRSQAAWKRFLRADCNGFAGQIFRGGTLAPVEQADCVINDTRSRIHDLQAFGKPFS